MKNMKCRFLSPMIIFLLFTSVNIQAQRTKCNYFGLCQYMQGSGKLALVNQDKTLMIMSSKEYVRRIFKMDFAEPEFIRLTEDNKNISDFAYNVSAHAIYYSAGPLGVFGNQLFRQNLMDSKNVQLTNEKIIFTTMAFGPDGKQLLVSVEKIDEDSGADLCLFNEEKKEFKYLTHGPEHDLFPYCLPNGKSIIFFRANWYGNNSPIALPHWHCWQPMLLTLDQGSPVPLSEEKIYNIYWPLVSPDGRWIVYMTDYYEANNVCLLDRGSMDRNDQDSSTNTFLPKRIEWPSNYNDRQVLFPVFSPDSKYLIFVLPEKFVAVPYSFENTDLFIMDLATFKITRLTTINRCIENPVISQDGGKIFFLINTDPKGMKDPTEESLNKYEIWSFDIKEEKIIKIR